MLRVILAGLVLAFMAGCATNNPRFQTETPSDQITGEKVCEVPQHWKALALEGVDTRKLTQATVVQIRIPAEWIGDALGWFVERDDGRAMEHYPRYVWQTIMVDGSGKQLRFPAIMKNPLIAPYLTVVINDPTVRPSQEAMAYVLSGAHTKLLTVAGDRLALPHSQDCLKLVDAEFIRSFPSQAVVSVAPERLLAGIRADFTKPSLQSDGQVYSIHPMALNKSVVGDLRQVTRGERTMERGATIAVSPVSPLPTLISGGVALAFHVLSEERYAGPFGERLYSSLEAKAALGRMTRSYNVYKRELETVLGVPYSAELVLHLDFAGQKSGWEIGDMLALQVEAAWKVLERLQERAQYRRNNK